MKKIGIIGAGNLGANAAFFLAEKNIGPVTMRDEKEGLATGKALDIMEESPLARYQFPVRGTDNELEVLDSDIVLIAAGAIRQPGAKRESVWEANRALVEDIARKMTGFPGVVVIATEPVDAAVTLFQSVSGIAASRVIGVAGALDGERLRYLVARELGCVTEDVDAVVVGRHDVDMIVPPNYTRVSGIPAEHVLPSGGMDAILSEVRNAGDSILASSKRSSAYYAPAMVAAEIIQAVVNDSRRILSVSTVLSGTSGVRDVALSMPAMIGESGVERLLEPRLSEQELEQLHASARAISQLVK